MGQLEDDPLEFIRLDLALPGSGAGATAHVTTRSQAAADVLPEATDVVGKWMGEGSRRTRAQKGRAEMDGRLRTV